MNRLSLLVALLVLFDVVLALQLGGQDSNRAHHRVAVVLTWEGSEWSALPSQIIPGSVQVFRNGLAIADGIDYGYSMDAKRFTLFASKPDDVILVTYDAE